MKVRIKQIRAATAIVVGLTLMLVLLRAGADDWGHYGGGLDGARFARGQIITPETVTGLERAWLFQTGDATHDDGRYFGRRSSFKATPILVGGKLVFSTGFNRVIALDPTTGGELWRYDPKVDFTIQYSEMFTSRGVAAWRDPEAEPDDECATRIFLGTLDARLIAVDAANGRECDGFGTRGLVDLTKGIANFRRGDYSMTSSPTVVNDTVITGSSVGDNGGVELDSGVVRGWDARTGRLRWSWDPIPRDPSKPGWESWEHGSGRRTGAANVWTTISADADRDLVFLPTTSPSPDFYGGSRLGDNRYANSIVALRATTGELEWAYQVVHHDLWDYDLASQPLLLELDIDGRSQAALALATKMGFVFVLDRETGIPLLPVTEREVPQSDVPGERAAPTQRVPSITLHPVAPAMPKTWEYDEVHANTCRQMIAGARYEGPFTPPSLNGTLLYPGNPGGVNWGSMAAHTERGIAFVAVNRLPTLVKLIPRKDFSRLARIGKLNGFDAQFTAQSGTPYGMARYEVYNRDNSLPCYEGPWATLVALNLSSGAKLWEVPAGVAPNLHKGSEAVNWGFYIAGGPMATAGGVVFLATPFDYRIRAYDMHDGRVLWSAELPAQPHATPMSYELDGAQYVLITAGGDRADGKGRGDYLVAFRLSQAKKP
jgi:quinoprotein glucose dehydrogenase